jgi:hypothetical protein
MSNKPPVPGPTLAEKREKTVQLLIDSFASDRLSVEEFEDRLDRAHRAGDAGTLESLISDLPVPAAGPPQPAPVQAAGTPAPRPAVRPDRALPEEVRERQFMAAVMGGFERKGPWVPARHTSCLCLMGGAVLDFREARLPPGPVEVDIFAMMGGVEIIVPPWIGIDTGGIAIMGGFEDGTANRTTPLPPDAPVIRIGGFLFMGGVEVSIRMPGESASAAKKRLRAERKQLKAGKKGYPESESS